MEEGAAQQIDRLCPELAEAGLPPPDDESYGAHRDDDYADHTR